ncbi:MAG: hypothetical protein OEU46_23150, partial [Alphaproteobacteria bacterium]|nr:hypothetical protein [Alphaproteobacteria bacterium]
TELAMWREQIHSNGEDAPDQVPVSQPVSVPTSREAAIGFSNSNPVFFFLRHRTRALRVRSRCGIQISQTSGKVSRLSGMIFAPVRDISLMRHC